MKNFEPLNELELYLLAAKKNEIPVEIFLKNFVHSNLALPSATLVETDGNLFNPIVYDKYGTKMLAAFSDKSRIGELVKIGHYCIMMNALQILQRIPSGHGLVVNPGHTVGFDISPEGIAKIVKDFA